MKKACITLGNHGEQNMHFAGKLAKLFGLDLELLQEELKELKNFDENLKAAKVGYEMGETKLPLRSLKIS